MACSIYISITGMSSNRIDRYQETKRAVGNRYSGSKVAVAVKHTSNRPYQQESVTRSSADYIKHTKMETMGIQTEAIETRSTFECKCVS